MAARIYNYTPWPDALLRRLANETGRRTGARTNVPIKVVRKRGGGWSSGKVKGCAVVNKRWLQGRPWSERREEWVRSNGAYMVLRVPVPLASRRRGDTFVATHRAGGDDCALSAARSVVSTLYHEWEHVRQFQQREPTRSDRPYRQRPHEIAARDSSEDLVENPTKRIDDLIVEAAEYLAGYTAERS